MHAANVEKSFRLRRMLAALQDARHYGATTYDLQVQTGSMAVHSDVAELRANGYLVSCDCEGTTQSGRRINRWRLVGRKP